VTVLLLRVLERIHGHAGWLVVAALLHPAIILRDRKRRAVLSVSLATAFATATGLLGAYIYPEYRLRLKQRIFIESPSIGWLFERKEHLAVGAIAFAVIGCIAHLTVRSFDDDAQREIAARLAHRSFVVSFALALMVAVIGVVVASHKSF
jgi:hypothetical protein